MHQDVPTTTTTTTSTTTTTTTAASTTSTTPHNETFNIQEYGINIVAEDTIDLSFGLNFEALVIEPSDPQRLFIGYDYDEATDMCKKVRPHLHLPIIGADSDKQVRLKNFFEDHKDRKILYIFVR